MAPIDKYRYFSWGLRIIINLTLFASLFTNPLYHVYILYGCFPFQETDALQAAHFETEGIFQYKSGNHFKSVVRIILHYIVINSYIICFHVFKQPFY